MVRRGKRALLIQPLAFAKARPDQILLCQCAAMIYTLPPSPRRETCSKVGTPLCGAFVNAPAPGVRVARLPPSPSALHRLFRLSEGCEPHLVLASNACDGETRQRVLTPCGPEFLPDLFIEEEPRD